VVGKSGSGKSTLVQALLRTIEYESDPYKYYWNIGDSKLTIDGQEIKSLGLHTLRKGIMVIPQETTIITGTLWINIDPFQKYEISELFRVLKITGLLEALLSKLVESDRMHIMNFESWKSLDAQKSFLKFLQIPLDSNPQNISQGEA